MEHLRLLQKKCKVIAKQMEELIEKAPDEGYDACYVKFLKKQHKLYDEFSKGLKKEVESEEKVHER